MLTMQPLQGCGIVITRPAHQTQQAEQQLTASGATVLTFPLLEITEPRDNTRCLSQLADIHIQDCIIFTSANAVRYALAKLPQPFAIGCQIAAVGKKTAKALADHGIEVTLVPDCTFNSEAVLALAALQDITGQKISIIRGEGGRELLKKTLTERGAEVAYVDVYRRICPTASLLPFIKFIKAQTPAIILLTSEESLINLFEISKGHVDLNQSILLLGSQRIAGSSILATHKGKQLISSDPSDESIYNCLVAWAHPS